MALPAWPPKLVQVAGQPKVLLTALAVLLATQIVPWWGPTRDGSSYVSIARSIAQPGPITNLGSPKLHYSPGFPVLISAAFFSADRPWLLLSLLQWAFGVAFMLGLYCWSRRWFGSGALWITALVMVNASLWMHARTTLSEVAFMAALIWTANAADQLVAARGGRAICAWTAGVALAVLALGLIRPVGILLVAGYGTVVLCAAWQRQTSWLRALATTFAIGMPGALAVVGVIAYEAQMATQVSNARTATYLHEFRSETDSLPAQLVEGLRTRTSEIGRLVVPGMHKAYSRPGQWLHPNNLIYLPLFGGLLWAWWRLARGGGNSLWMMAPFYFALHVAYPVDQGTRYMLPLLPLFAVGIWWLIDRLPRRQHAVLCSLIFLQLIVTAGTSARGIWQLHQLDAHWAALDTFANAIYGDDLSVLVYGGPTGLAEMAQVAVNRPINATKNDRRLLENFDWVIVTNETETVPGYVVASQQGELKLLRRSDGVSHQHVVSRPTQPPRS